MHRTIAVTVLAALWAAPTRADGSWVRDVDMDTFFRDTIPLAVNPQRREKVFPAAKDRANFTFFHGVDHVTVKDGVLSFVMHGDKATLGWGNYAGRQAVTEIAPLFPEHNQIDVRMRQTCTGSVCRAQFWVDGKAIEPWEHGRDTLQVAGKDWQVVSFAPYRGQQHPVPDGFELVISAPEGTRIDIDSVNIFQAPMTGYLRKEFTIPEGRIWKAVADAAWGDDRRWCHTDVRISLYANGEHVDRRTAEGIYAVRPVSLKGYLQPGLNCVGIHARNCWMPVPMRLTVVMESGEVVEMHTGPEWTRAAVAPEGWSEPGFDDGNWEPCSWAKGRCNPYQQTLLPGDHSRFKLSNPYKRDLFYGTTRDVILSAMLPAGLRAQTPVVEIVVERGHRNGVYEPVARHQESSFTIKDGSLVYALNLGRLAQGVYTVALRAGSRSGRSLAERAREPFVVIDNKPPSVVSPKDYTSGMDLTLEHEIDFTDANDPHPYWESEFVDWRARTKRVDQPLVVHTNGLVYRELRGQTIYSGMNYRLGEFAHPGDFYLVELDYPDNAHRIIDVFLAPTRNSLAGTGVGAETGGKFYTTGKMQTLRWLHVADTGVHTLGIFNSTDGCPAAVSKLRIYHVNSRLPSAGAGSSRWFGTYTERCHQYSGHGRNFGCDTTDRRGLQALAKEQTITQVCVRQLVEWQEICDRYADYLKFSGQNFHHIGCVQYGDVENTPMKRVNKYYDSPRITFGFRTMMANILNMREIGIIAGIQLSHSKRLDTMTYANNAMVAQGADTMWMVDAEGRQMYGMNLSTVVPNWQDRRFREPYLQAIADCIDTFGDLATFQGIASQSSVAQRNCYYFPAYGYGKDYESEMTYSYDDLTISTFEKECGVDLGVDPHDPKRFQKRAALLSDPRIKPAFLQWRCDKLTEFFEDTVAYIHDRDPTLVFINVLWDGGQAATRHLVKAGESYESMMKRFAMDLPAWGRIPGMVPLRWTVSWRSAHRGGGAQNPYGWIMKERDIVLSAYDKLPRCSVLCRTSWNERSMFRPGVLPAEVRTRSGKGVLLEGSDWLANCWKTRTQPQPSGHSAREALIQGVITADPQIAYTGFTDAALNLGHEQSIRQVMTVYTHLPREQFERVLDTDLETNLVLRKLSKDGESWLYVANPGYWHARGALEITCKAPLLSIPGGRQAAKAGTKVSVPIDLEAFGLLAFRSSSPELQVVSYEVEPLTPRETAHITDKLARVEALMADPDVRVVLPLEDRTFMEKRIAMVRSALKERQFALAWSRLKHHRFWSYWQEFLEKAATAVSSLPDSVKMTPRASGSGLPVLHAVRAQGPIEVDGRLSEKDWNRKRFSGGFTAGKEGLPALNETAIKALYDDQALYLGVICADRHPEQLRSLSKEGRQLWSIQDDAIAVFLQPDETYPEYYQLAFNADGVQFNQRVRGGDKDYDFEAPWRARAQPADRYWTAEARFPFDMFGHKGPGRAQWRLNVGRAMRKGLLDVCAWAYSPDNWHSPERFGKLVFE